MYTIVKGSKVLLGKRSALAWRIVQGAVWVVGIFILSALVFQPALGLLLFWNILIPLAPAIFVFIPGVWRNICPMATTVLMPRKLKLSGRVKLSMEQNNQFQFIAIVLLYLIVPLRHAFFNTNGMGTALLIISLTAIGFTMGACFEWKSIWCSGLCPVHPVEKLYGSASLISVSNIHCTQCANCVVPCPDSTPNIQPLSTTKSFLQKVNGVLITGGLPGFIWGWFHVPDSHEIHNFHTFLQAYYFPVLGFTITLSLYLIIEKWASSHLLHKIQRAFAAAGVSCYYWFRIPALLGMGKYNKDGLLIDLSSSLPHWIPLMITISTTTLFFYWLVIKEEKKRSWLIRPVFEK